MKKKLDVVRAWTDEEYRSQLTAEELSLLPDHPAGVAELTDEEVTYASGATSINWWEGCRSIQNCTAIDCTGGATPCY